MSVLSVEGVTYTYPGAERPALRDVSVGVEEGELVVLAGGTGSGKSTLLLAASGLVPHYHGGEFAGRVLNAGRDTRDHAPGELAAACGTLLQDPETQVVMGGVRAELLFGLENRGHSPAAAGRAVEEVALALGIAGLLERSVHELSGGELQRVALGAALAPAAGDRASGPPLLLLDEPTSQLDPVAGDELVWLLRRLNEEWGAAIVLAEHRLERCLPATDRVVAMEEGAIACDAPPREFLRWAGSRAPALQTPAARLFAAAGLAPPPVGVRDARRALRARGLLPHTARRNGATPSTAAPRGEPALRLDRVWQEWPGGRAALRGVSLELRRGERVALMGRNGAGKSTLLRIAGGLLEPSRGRVDAAGRVALLLQAPKDYLVAERVGDELPQADLARAGLAELAGRHPHDLSGGERQRLAIAIVTASGDGIEPPAVTCLDEPTRGMDRARRDELAADLRALSQRGCAVLVATHDPELAAAVAERVVLLGDGVVVADGPAEEVLGEGWYFSTETARVLGGVGRAVDPATGAQVLREAMALEAAR